MGKANTNGDFVYSTNPDFEPDAFDDADTDTLPPGEQTLEVLRDRKGRKGKTAVVVRGFVGTEDDLKALGKTLKTKCGVGGSVKDGEIIIQGDVRDKVIEILNSLGYGTKRVGG